MPSKNYNKPLTHIASHPSPEVGYLCLVARVWTAPAFYSQ